MILPGTVDWPIDARPTVRIAVQAPLMASGFEFGYRHATHALHLHDYDGAIRIGGRTYALSPGTLTWSPANVDSSYDLRASGTHWCVHFESPAKRRPRASAAPTVAVPLIQHLGPRRQEGVGRFVHLIRLRSLLQSRPDAAAEAAMGVACQELILWAALLERGATASSPPRSANGNAIVEKTIEYVDRNLHCPLRAAHLAAAAGVTQNYLARLFRRHTGQAIPAYVIGRRIALANLLLTTTDLPIKQVALRVGTANAQQFNKQFRRFSGTSPSAARRMSLAR